MLVQPTFMPAMIAPHINIHHRPTFVYENEYLAVDILMYRVYFCTYRVQPDWQTVYNCTNKARVILPSCFSGVD